ncbi:MAG: hypothetical protein ACYS9C_18600, partial [Planctomycetota bacterium]
SSIFRAGCRPPRWGLAGIRRLIPSTRISCGWTRTTRANSGLLSSHTVYLVLLGNMVSHLNYGKAQRLYYRIIPKPKGGYFAFLDCTEISDS